MHAEGILEDDSELLKKIGGRPILWVGAISFEDRCSASVCRLKQVGVQIKAMRLLEYKTNTNPQSIGQERKLKNEKRLQILGQEAGAHDILRVPIDPYSFQDMQRAMETLIGTSSPGRIVIDISCMTKIHTLALAATLSRASERVEWAIAYSVPEVYGNLHKTPKIGWRDIIVAPLAETALLLNEAYSRGIVVAGHEPDRLIVALGELEPSGGIILIADTPRRPDLRYVSERKNQRIVRQLTGMRSSDWSKHILALFDIQKLRASVAGEIKSAKSRNAPVIVFPYGPKILLFQIALQLSSEYPEASWFVMPIPAAYDVHYSEGSGRTIWFAPPAGWES